MMRDLLCKDLCAILSECLVRLTKDWIERLFKVLRVVCTANLRSYYKLESLNRFVIEECRLAHVEWKCGQSFCEDYQGALMCHATDWETYPRQVELTI